MDEVEDVLVTCLLEVRQETFPAPVRLPPKIRSPSIVVFPLPTNDLHAIYARAAAQDLARNDGNSAIVQARLWSRGDVESEGRVDQAPEPP